MTKGDLLNNKEFTDLPDDAELEIHLAIDDGSADFSLEPIGQVIGPVNPAFFTFRVGEFISDCG